MIAYLHISPNVPAVHIALFIFVIRSLLDALAWVHDSGCGCGVMLCRGLDVPLAKKAFNGNGSTTTF